MRHPTFCGQNFLDTQENVSYTAASKKEVLINSIQFNSISISISPDSFIVRRAVNLFMGALSNFLAISIDNSVKFNIIQKEKSEGCRLMNVVGFL